MLLTQSNQTMPSKKTLHFVITEQSTAQLRARQSVRTTFRLPEKSILAISILAKQLGIRQKSIFDHLMQELDKPDKTMQVDEENTEPRVPKTFVISRGTLEYLEQISRRYSIPRDILMEHAIERILPLLDEEKQKHTKRKKILKHLNAISQQSLSLFKQSIKELGDDDPVNTELYKMMRSLENSRSAIERFIERNEKIEKF